MHDRQTSSDQVSNRIHVIDSIGSNHDSGNETVGPVNPTVRRPPSTDEIDRRTANAQRSGPTGARSILYLSTEEGAGESTGSELKAAADAIPVLNSRDDRLRMDFDVGSFTSPLSAVDRPPARGTANAT